MDKILDYEEQVTDNYDKSIRPINFDEYIGQTEVKENVKVFVKAALLRDKTLDHVLLYGPPGLGKTTLAHIIANELGVDIKTANGPTIEKTGDLAAILSSLEPRDVLFIDEIHRMPRYIEEVLYSAMEDYQLDIIIGNEGQTRNIKIDLPPFTLIGATTRAGDLSSPLRDRFGITCKLEYYTEEELKQIVKRSSGVLDVNIEDSATEIIAKRSRKTPRIANRLLKRVADFALVEGNGVITDDVTLKALKRLGVDETGLDKVDLEYLSSIIIKFNGGPVGIDSIASTIGEESTNIEDVIEPFLLQEGYLKRTARGRIATEKAYEVLDIKRENTLF
mgnify:FL=1